MEGVTRANHLRVTTANADTFDSAATTLRAHADALDASGHPDLAKRYREAAHRQAESAACLRGERQWATPEDIEPTPPMTLERACEVLTAQLFQGRKWRCTAATAYGDGISSDISPSMCPGYIAIAVAEKLLRDAAAAPAKEVG